MGVRAWIAAALLIVWSVALLFLGFQAGRAQGADRAADLLSKQMDAALDEQEQGRKDRQKLQRTLDALPKSEGKVREVVRHNPAKCERPAAVSDRVRQAAREANAAREMPSDF